MGNWWQRTRLSRAVSKGKLERVRSLLEKGADPNWTNSEGNTMLGAAARYGHPDIVRILLKYGADVNKTTEVKCWGGGTITGVTPLMSACGDLGGDIESVKLLLDAGADVNAAESFGNTALAISVYWQYHNLELFDLLIKAGADVDTHKEPNPTPLCYAAQNGLSEVARILVRAGADCNARDSKGRTPLMFAARKGDINLVKELLQAGADRRVQDHKGHTMAWYACRAPRRSRNRIMSVLGLEPGS
jgi:ankyrin repeat protein